MRLRQRHVQTARAANASFDSLVVTHPFHPLCGQRVAILYERRLRGARLYVCEGPLGSIGILEDATDRGPEPALMPLSGEVLATLVALVAAVGGELLGRAG